MMNDWITIGQRKRINDCWMDRYGHVYEVAPFKHDDFATNLLQDEFPIDKINEWETDLYRGSYSEELMHRGWVRYTTTTEQWCCGHDWGGWEIYPRPTRAQIDKMYDLTGYIYE